MCTILLAWRCVEGAPIVLAANRDELVRRPSAGPTVLLDEPLIAGGRDLLAGGTWLAVRADGTVAAVTNRRAGPGGEVTRDAARRSRGELPLAMLTAGDGDADAVERLLRAVGAQTYNPVNALWVSDTTALVMHADGGSAPRVGPLEPGPHVLCVHDVDEVSQPKEGGLLARLRGVVATSAHASAVLAGMEEVLRDHGGDGRAGIDSACIHGDQYGTVSSSSVVVAADGAITYRHAPGRPCVTAAQDASALLRAHSAR